MLKLSLLACLCLPAWLAMAGTGALENYLAVPDTNYSWKAVGEKKEGAFTVTHLQMVSQKWREFTWTHDIQVVCPELVRNPRIAFLLITGNGTGASQVRTLQILAQNAGAIAAVVTRVPNQPLYEGRSEDALISYTFLKYLETGDETWPLLFPMVKTAVRAMDTVQAFAASQYKQSITNFVVSGASKRGWTTYLTAAMDRRVQGMAPMVIDMLNMKVQLDWSQKVYGKQSEMIHDYTDLKLQERMDEPAMVKLRGWVDPYNYRERYTMPKLLLLGSNDPYWTVDSLRHYWNALPAPKLLYITPNAGHDLAKMKEALPTLTAFFTMVADGKPLPKLDWQITDLGQKAEVTMHVSEPAKGFRLWTATSLDRDFRNDQWSSAPVANASKTEAKANVAAPPQGYGAYMMEAQMTSPEGLSYKLSTEARVTPDSIK